MVDVGNSAFATTILAALFPIYLPSLLPPQGVVLSFLGWSWTTSAISIWGYTVSLSLLLTFFMAPILGAWADERGLRKKLLGVFTILGAVATSSLAFFDTWQAALSLFVIANIGFSASNIFYNSLLPVVAEEKEWDSLSLKGFAWGYIGGGILLAINLGLIMKHEFLGLESRKSGLAISFFSVGVWWLCFTLPALFQIHERAARKRSDPFTGIHRQFHLFWKTLKDVVHSRTLLLFMISFALYNDGISTVISMASIFGKEVLRLPEETLIGTLLLIQFLGLPFTLLMTRVSKIFGAKQTLLYALALWVGIIAYGYSMQTSADFFWMGVFVAIVLGVSQALPRSIFASLIPAGRQAEYFSFFALSGKMTSIIGPTLFALVKDASGDARLSILTLGILFVLGMILLSFVSIDRARPAR